MAEDLNAVAEAFSRKAKVYDAFGLDHPNLQRMRSKVREHVQRLLRPGDRILELNAGTGADAAYFARLGYSVHAIDISPGMVAEIEQKIEAGGFSGRITAQCCSFEDLGNVGGPYDYIFSNMGGVNCTPELARITCQLPELLKPKGRVTWVVMPPICLWELAGILRGRPRTAMRRLQRGGVYANVEGVTVKTWYYPPHQVITAFGRAFRVLQLSGLSVFTPTADRKDFPLRSPRVYSVLRWMDERLSDFPILRSMGDFYILSLEHRP